MGFEAGKPTSVGRVQVKAHTRKAPSPPTPDQQDRARGVQPGGPKAVRGIVHRTPAAKDAHRAPQEQQLLSQAHSVRVQARAKNTQQRGTSPSGDRPQGRAKEMGESIYTAGPSVGHPRTPALPRGAQQRGSSPSGDRPQGRAQEMRAAPVVARMKKGKGPGLGMALVHLPTAYVKAITSSDVTPGGLDIAGNAIKDAAELAVTTPSSVAKLASTAATHPKKVPGMLAQPYKDLAKHPAQFVSEHPVSTALMLAPAARLPGRAVGRVARVAGKQTLERPAATLPGTSLKEARTGSRDVVMRAVQARADRKGPAPTMTEREVQRRVDEFHDLAKHHAAHAEAQAIRATRRATRGQPKAVRRPAIEQAKAQAREAARHENDERFAREFGATGRLSTGAAERELTGRVRKSAETDLNQAQQHAAAADAAHTEALASARVARAKVHRSSALASLESRRRDALREVATAQRAQVTARVGQGTARGRAEVLSRNVGGGGHAGGYGVRLARQDVDAAATGVRDARARVRQLDQEISAERQRVRGIPPAEHQALVNAIHGRVEARSALGEARTAAEMAKTQHIATKVGMRESQIVNPAGEGRMFAHEADAATLVRKLNEVQPESDPITFVVHQAGDRFSAVPQVAKQRLAKHYSVGSSPATMAKILKRSRGAFTQAVLPLSPKWLAGQGIEAGIRATVARAGPMDLLRMNRVVKKLNAQKPGAGDELLMRVSGGQFGLTGTAREFAQGKSLAEEFEDTSLKRPMAAVSSTARTLPARAVRAGWSKYTSVVLDAINGAIENNARKAMAGQAIRQGTLMERHVIGLTDKAIEDAARGLRGSENQVRLAREVDRMYGKYQKFSPEKRSLLLHWTPFLPWYLNTVTFLSKVLPIDHPVMAALLADTSVATEEWRKSHDLSLLQANHVPDFLLGSYPKRSGYLRVAHYTPFGVGSDVSGAVGALTLPQFSTTIENLKGIDWKGQRLKHPGYGGKEFNQGERIVRAFVTAAESQLPGVSQVGQITGLTPRYVDKKKFVPSPGEALKKMLPTTPTQGVQSNGPRRVVGKVRLNGAGSGGARLNGAGSGGAKLN